MGTAPSFYLAFIAGILSFISPCCLPLYPSYISYITGITLEEMKSEDRRRKARNKALGHALFFVLGFSFIFISLGMSASLVGRLFAEYKSFVRQAGGLLIIVMGLFLAGMLQLDFLYRQKKWQFRAKPVGYIGSALVGISFAAGWTPCVGPILASVLVLAATNPASGLWFMFFYTLGFAVPFLLLAYTLGSIRWILKYSEVISKIGGWLLVIMGMFLFTGWINNLTSWFIRMFGGFIGI
ncbi:cytochrome C biogenesis protein CcdA [Collibacillus ludicampi]|uniref:Cytochrome C biogenesis protein CcdA n=1 Tax=Collibacillus ludicampi TaxID=2771369 RepID=A0AAV4LEW3_9BACL|nr:cytochrome c biogenesis protein CcdA [Collibacillus ludicampi]GIM46213.1 cytochrome C biogenesis protein CcdA [Collibacillus ludicampi]